MKKLLFTLTLCLGFIFGNAQEVYYKAVLTELYVFSETTQEWELTTRKSDVNIRIVVEDEFITFQAKSPSMYKIYTTTKKTLETKSMKGFRYDAKDLKNDDMVNLDVLREVDGEIGMISVVNQKKGINLRFFIIGDK